MVDGATDSASVGFTVGSEEGAIYDGASLGLRIGDALGNDDGSINDCPLG